VTIELEAPYLKDAHGVPFSKGSKLENLVMLHHNANRMLEAESLYWYSSSSQFGWQRTEPAAALLELSDWLTEVFRALEPENISYKHSFVETAIRSLEDAVKLCKAKLTPDHLVLDELTGVFADLTLGRKPYLYKIIGIAEPSVYEGQPISVAVKRFEECLRILESQARIAIASGEPIEYPLDQELVLQARALLTELDMRATLTESSEGGS
jgi:hypothetical protein